MKNIFKTFVAGAFIVIISTVVIIFGVGAVKGFTSIANATGWIVVLHFIIGITCTISTLFGAFIIGSLYLSVKRYDRNKYTNLVCSKNDEGETKCCIKIE